MGNHGFARALKTAMNHSRLAGWVLAVSLGSAVARAGVPVEPFALTLPKPRAVQLSGPLGEALDRGIRRYKASGTYGDSYTCRYFPTPVTPEVQRRFRR
jgi:hypothetical protein